MTRISELKFEANDLMRVYLNSPYKTEKDQIWKRLLEIENLLAEFGETLTVGDIIDTVQCNK